MATREDILRARSLLKEVELFAAGEREELVRKVAQALCDERVRFARRVNETYDEEEGDIDAAIGRLVELMGETFREAEAGDAEPAQAPPAAPSDPSDIGPEARRAFMERDAAREHAERFIREIWREARNDTHYVHIAGGAIAMAHALGALTDAERELWERRLTECPGHDDEGGRVWCAYCGDMPRQKPEGR